jgi:hypothetical protein
MLKGVLHDAIEKAMDEFTIPEVAKNVEEKVKKRLKLFLINYGRENVSLGMTIDMKCLNIIDEKWFMVSVSISDVDKFLVGWYNESNEPEISVFDDLDTAQTVYDSIRNKLKQFGLIE